jgi:hypothetical protein
MSFRKFRLYGHIRLKHILGKRNKLKASKLKFVQFMELNSTTNLEYHNIEEMITVDMTMVFCDCSWRK